MVSAWAVDAWAVVGWGVDAWAVDAWGVEGLAVDALGFATGDCSGAWLEFASDLMAGAAGGDTDWAETCP